MHLSLAWIWTWLRRLLGLLLLLGPKPRHVAFIMDGNRRFATSKRIDKITGHKQGYSKMIDVVHWCLELGVPCISVYAFSIDNFNRSPEEVASLMQLADEKYLELSQEHGLAERKGIEIRVLGDLSLAPSSVQGAAARMMQATSKLRNKTAVLNICFSYIATEEIVQAVDAIQHAVHGGELHPGDVTPALLDACMHTYDCPPVDLMIRTSGETRLSEFLLWQSRGARLEFIERMWPDFCFLDWARCVLRYQRSAAAQQRLRRLCVDAGAPAAPPVWRAATAALLQQVLRALLRVAAGAWLMLTRPLLHKTQTSSDPKPSLPANHAPSIGQGPGRSTCPAQALQDAPPWTSRQALQLHSAPPHVVEAQEQCCPTCGCKPTNGTAHHVACTSPRAGEARVAAFLRKRDANRRDWIAQHVGCR